MLTGPGRFLAVIAVVIGSAASIHAADYSAPRNMPAMDKETAARFQQVLAVALAKIRPGVSANGPLLNGQSNMTIRPAVKESATLGYPYSAGNGNVNILNQLSSTAAAPNNIAYPWSGSIDFPAQTWPLTPPGSLFQASVSLAVKGELKGTGPRFNSSALWDVKGSTGLEVKVTGGIHWPGITDVHQSIDWPVLNNPLVFDRYTVGVSIDLSLNLEGTFNASSNLTYAGFNNYGSLSFKASPEGKIQFVPKANFTPFYFKKERMQGKRVLTTENHSIGIEIEGFVGPTVRFSGGFATSWHLRKSTRFDLSAGQTDLEWGGSIKFKFPYFNFSWKPSWKRRLWDGFHTSFQINLENSVKLTPAQKG
jgi:hypothetical protein